MEKRPGPEKTENLLGALGRGTGVVGLPPAGVAEVAGTLAQSPPSRSSRPTPPGPGQEPRPRATHGRLGESPSPAGTAVEGSCRRRPGTPSRHL